MNIPLVSITDGTGPDDLPFAPDEPVTPRIFHGAFDCTKFQGASSGSVFPVTRDAFAAIERVGASDDACCGATVKVCIRDAAEAGDGEAEVLVIDAPLERGGVKVDGSGL